MGVKFTDELYKFGIDTKEYDFESKDDEWEMSDSWEDEEVEVDTEVEFDAEVEVEKSASVNVKNRHCFRGEIEVTSFIVVRGDLEPLSGVKVLLFKEDRCSPRLIASKITDRRGEVEFNNLEEGTYIIAQPIDKCHFEHPIFIPSDRVVLNRENREAEVAIINRLRRRHHGHCHNRCDNDFDDCAGKSDRSHVVL